MNDHLDSTYRLKAREQRSKALSCPDGGYTLSQTLKTPIYPRSSMKACIEIIDHESVQTWIIREDGSVDIPNVKNPFSSNQTARYIPSFTADATVDICQYMAEHLRVLSYLSVLLTPKVSNRIRTLQEQFIYSIFLGLHKPSYYFHMVQLKLFLECILDFRASRGTADVFHESTNLTVIIAEKTGGLNPTVHQNEEGFSHGLDLRTSLTFRCMITQ